MIVPSGATVASSDEAIQTSRTYRIDLGEGAGTVPDDMIDEIEAVRQSAVHSLNTKRGKSPIYSYDYGFDDTNLDFNDRASFQSELIRRVQEALLQDDRITSVDNFSFVDDGDNTIVRFTVKSIFGTFNEEKMVSQNV